MISVTFLRRQSHPPQSHPNLCYLAHKSKKPPSDFRGHLQAIQCEYRLLPVGAGPLAATVLADSTWNCLFQTFAIISLQKRFFIPKGIYGTKKVLDSAQALRSDVFPSKFPTFLPDSRNRQLWLIRGSKVSDVDTLLAEN